MQLPLQITFHNLDRSEAVEARIRERAEKLEQYYGRIMGCRVAVEAQHKHHRHGNHYHVRIDVTVPNGELVASRQPDEHHSHTDVYVAVRDAFDAICRQLEDYGRRERRQFKSHEVPPHGRIVEFSPDEVRGRIETPDGKLVYAGAIDDSPSGSPKVNYVAHALDALASGKRPNPASTQPYGCSVKY